MPENGKIYMENQDEEDPEEGYLFDEVTGKKKHKFIDKLNQKKVSKSELHYIFYDSLEDNKI